MSIATERRASVSVEIGGQEIIFETGKLAKQADGAVVVRSRRHDGARHGAGPHRRRARARTSSRSPSTSRSGCTPPGKIPGGFFKREGRATERAILTARMIDRPIRPLWPKGFRNEVQVICTMLSADLVTPHDILCINGASAALMISPLPFLGPVGAVRIGLIEGELVVNPTLHAARGVDARPDRRRHEGRPDDGRGRRRRGARGEAARGARARARRDPQALRGAGGPAAPGRQAEVARPRAHRRARARARPRDLGADPGATACARAARSSRSSLAELAPELVDGRRPRRTSPRRCRCGRASTLLLEKQRLVAVEAPVREQFENDLRALTDAEQDSKELKSAKRHAALRPHRRGRRAAVPGRPGDGRRRGAGRQGLAHEAVRQEGGRGDLQGPRPQEDRRRQAAARRPRHRGDPADRRARSASPAHARLGALHARADADHVAAHARHREGGPADRRPLARGASAATCTTTTSRPTRSGRRASCAARSGATSATARSRSGRSRR